MAGSDEIRSRARLGGQRRAAQLSASERSEIARRAAESRWGTTIQTATHVGEMVIGDMQIACAVLKDGTRVLSQATVLTALGRHPEQTRRSSSSGELRAPFLSAQNLQPFITAELHTLSEPIPYRHPVQRIKSWGYRAEMLPMVCEVYLEARAAGMLVPRQRRAAHAAEVLVRGLAKVGIVALVDEATGYQEVRARNELQKILEAYVSPELMPWVKRFPDEFFREIYHLHNWEYRPGTSKRTPYVGKLVNKYIYEQLPPGVLDELRTRNPRIDGRRQHKHHQFLTENTGNPHLDKQIATVTTLMRIAHDKAEFEDMFDRAFSPQQRLPLLVPVEDE